ncbi:MAG: glutaredoxin family protein [Pirellulales bacterium]|nr:glutaredoxin family protein [Pirellulales bacterium]
MRDAPLQCALYTRLGCHLCEQAEKLLHEHGLLYEKIDVDADETLRERFGECVPVVEIAGQVRFRGRVDGVLLQRLLRAESRE